MSAMRRERRSTLLAAASVLLALAASVALASVFNYMPIQLTVAPVPPPVYFELGSNANEPDLGSGNTISVSLGDNKTSLYVTVHPTYWVTYYKDVARVTNADNKAYYVYIEVRTPLSLPSDSVAMVCVYGRGDTRDLEGWSTPEPREDTYIECVDLTEAAGPILIGTLRAETTWDLDLYFYIPEGTSPETSTAELHLIYSPSAETPP